MTRYIWNGQSWMPTQRRLPPSRRVLAGLAAPMIICDHMQPTQHPITGEVLESKSAFRARTRAHGCRELGNDAPVAPPRYQVDRADLRQDIAAAVAQVEQGYLAPPATTVAPDARIYK